jgi:hypothetical protein
MELTITVKDWEAQEVTNAVADRVIGRLEETITTRVQEEIDERIVGTIQELVTQVSREKIEAALNACLEAGWRQTNHYGEPTGPAVGLKERVSQILNARNSSYSNDGTFVEKAVKEEVDKVLRGELGKEIEKARADLRTALDEAVKTRLADAIKGAFGIPLR